MCSHTHSFVTRWSVFQGDHGKDGESGPMGPRVSCFVSSRILHSIVNKLLIWNCDLTLTVMMFFQGPPGQKGEQGVTEIIDYNGNIHQALQVGTTAKKASTHKHLQETLHSSLTFHRVTTPLSKFAQNSWCRVIKKICGVSKTKQAGFMWGSQPRDFASSEVGLPRCAQRPLLH